LLSASGASQSSGLDEKFTLSEVEGNPVRGALRRASLAQCKRGKPKFWTG